MGYVLGVDGGGTQTVCLLADLEGNVLGQGQAGPSNFQAVGLNEAIDSIEQAIRTAMGGMPMTSSPIVDAICLGLAGVDTPQDEELIRRHIEIRHIARQVCVVNDTEIALIGGVGGERGVAVVAGTGSAAFGCNGQGHKVRAGGWGWILGDEGSAFDIGRQGLRAVVRALEGHGEATALIETLMQQWHLTKPNELTASLRARTWSRSDVARLAEWVSQTALPGDGVAGQIMTRAGEDLGVLTTRVIEQLHLRGEFSIVLTGGVFRAGALIREPLQRTVHAVAPAAQLALPIHPPVLGAVFMAWRRLGLPLDRERMERAHATARAKAPSDLRDF